MEIIGVLPAVLSNPSAGQVFVKPPIGTLDLAHAKCSVERTCSPIRTT